MADTKLTIMAMMLLAMIGCGNRDKDADPQSIMEKYAPKDAAVAAYLDVSALCRGLDEAAEKYAREAKMVDLDRFMEELRKIDSAAVYLMNSENALVPVVVLFGPLRPADVHYAFAKLGDPLSGYGPRLESRGNGRYELLRTPLPGPILLIDAREADDLAGDMIVAGPPAILTPQFVATMGKNKCDAVTLAIEKTDTSAMAWGAGVIGEERKPRQPKTVLFSANFTGDKPIWFELTYDSEIIAEEAEEQWRKRTAVFGEAMSLKRLGSTITVENAGGASLADLLMLSIREELRDTKQAAACMRNLREIAMGSIVYASENDGESPASLEVMRDKGLVSSDGLRCPCPESQQRGGYFYWPPSPTAPGLTFVACELDSNHGRFRHVAMKNAAVLKMTEEAFQAKLKLPQNAAFAEALKKAEK